MKTYVRSYQPEEKFNSALLCSESNGQLMVVVVHHLQTNSNTRCQQVIGTRVEGPKSTLAVSDRQYGVILQPMLCSRVLFLVTI